MFNTKFCYFEYLIVFLFDLCHSILMQDDKKGGGDRKVNEKSDFENPAAKKDDKTVEGQVCDVEVRIKFISFKNLFMFLL